MISQNTENLDTVLDIQKTMCDMQLFESLKYKLQKDNVTLEDLLQIEEITIDGKNIIGKDNTTNLKDVELFPNLKAIKLRNIAIDENNIKWISRVQDISFTSCEIETLKEIKDCLSLEIIGCKVKDIEEINDFANLREFTIINTISQDFNYLVNKKKLDKLVIKNIDDFQMEKIDFNLPINYLSIEGIDKIDYDVLSKYKNLETISLDYIGQSETLKDVQKLKELGYKVKYNDMY